VGILAKSNRSQQNTAVYMYLYIPIFTARGSDGSRL